MPEKDGRKRDTVIETLGLARDFKRLLQQSALKKAIATVEYERSREKRRSSVEF